MVNELTASITALATTTCAELFDGDAEAEREYVAWLDERGAEWDATLAGAAAVGL